MPSSRPPKPTIAPAPPRTASGQHPAVQAYRRKLESMVDGAYEAITRLEADADACRRELESVPPPADNDDSKQGDPKP